MTESDPRPDLPSCITTYQQAHDRRDTDTALATFTEEATVIDEDKTYVGSEAIRGWLDTAASEFTYTRTLLGAEPLGDGLWLVRNRLDGNFPGGTAELRYQFSLRGELIDRLEIAP
jgi:ketosteroid isomerase-like protein